MRRAGMPRAYTGRVLRELEDHSEDLGRRSGAENPAHQLGDARRLADAFVEQYRDSHLCGRHPWIVFVLSPTLVASLALMVFLALSIPLPMAFEEAGWADQDTTARTLRTLALIGVRGVPTLFAAAFAWLAVRSSHGVRAICSSGVMLALLGASLQYRVDAPVLGRAGGEFALDLNLLQPNLPGLLLPLACALGFTLFDAWRRRTDGAELHT